jgi:molybdate transport system regulatory protein
VTAVIRGAVNSEIKMEVGTTVLTAVITNESTDELMIKEGDEIFAIFKASSVIIGMI